MVFIVLSSPLFSSGVVIYRQRERLKITIATEFNKEILNCTFKFERIPIFPSAARSPLLLH